MPILVAITGPAEAFAQLPSIGGVLLQDHGRHTLPDGRWQYSTYVTSSVVVDQIRALGLQVDVLQTAEQVQVDLQRIVDRNDGGGAS